MGVAFSVEMVVSVLRAPSPTELVAVIW